MKIPGNMQTMMKQAQQMQQKLQEEIAAIRVEASAGGGMVTVKMDGQKNVLGVKIDPEVAGDVEMLQDMMMAAFNEAARKWTKRRKEDGRHVGRHGSASWNVLNVRHARFLPRVRRAAARLITNSSGFPALGRNRRSESRFTFCARLAKMLSAWRRPCLTSKTSSAICAECNNISDGEICLYCRDPHRDHSLLCVVEEPHNILAG